MKIGIDLRCNFTKNNFLLTEIINILIGEIAKKQDFIFNIYLDKKINLKKEYENININYLDYSPLSIQNQINFKSLLKENNNDLNLFFDVGRPILYRGKNIVIVNNLDNLLYETPEVDNFAKKFKYFFLIEHSCLYANKILVFNNEAKIALNEKINIKEEKIKIVYPFFFKKEYEIVENIMQKNNFILYNSGNAKHNLEVLLKALFEYNSKNVEKLDLIIFGEDYNDVELRKLALQYDLINNIKELENNSKYLGWYYKNAICLVYPGYYENFPIEFNDAINLNTPIIASKTESIKEIFNEKIIYFKHSSSLDLTKKIEELQKTKQKFDYSEELKKYTKENFIKNLFEEIQNIV